MRRICPQGDSWARLHRQLINFSRSNSCKPTEPPEPLILAGWAFSNDAEKIDRWDKTVLWARENGCMEIVDGLSNDEFYQFKLVMSAGVSPNGGPMLLPWNFEARTRPEKIALDEIFMKLMKDWVSIVGDELASATFPTKITGKKARRLVVKITSDYVPPWGDWSVRSADEAKRGTFSLLRQEINRCVAPHVFDHIDFIDPSQSKNTPKPVSRG